MTASPSVESEIPLNQLATVHVLLSNTVEANGGWFKAEIGVTVPCKIKDIESTYKKTKDFVENKVSKQISDMCEVGRVI